MSSRCERRVSHCLTRLEGVQGEIYKNGKLCDFSYRTRYRTFRFEARLCKRAENLEDESQRLGSMPNVPGQHAPFMLPLFGIWR